MPKSTSSKRVRPKVVVLVGLPGSGKSTYAENSGGTALSSDEFRRLLADDPKTQAIHRLVFATLRLILKHRLELKRPVTYIDATNLTIWERRPYIKLAKHFQASAEAIFFDIPVEVCQRRNRKRDRVVPETAIIRMAEGLEPPTKSEGFSKVTRVGLG